jgi:hypothetical protein
MNQPIRKSGIFPGVTDKQVIVKCCVGHTADSTPATPLSALGSQAETCATGERIRTSFSHLGFSRNGRPDIFHGKHQMLGADRELVKVEPLIK